MDTSDMNKTAGADWEGLNLGIDLRDLNMWDVIALYKDLFERGESLEDVIEREHIDIRRQPMPAGQPSLCVFREGGVCTILVDENLFEDDYRRAVAHELYHYFKRDKPDADQEHAHHYDCNARRFAEFYLIQRHHSIPDLGTIALIIMSIDKTLKSQEEI